MDYQGERERLYENKRKMQEATEDIGLEAGENYGEKERDLEDQLKEAVLDVGEQFMETMIDIAESLYLIREKD